MGNIYFVYMTLKNNVGGYALSDACLTRGDEYLHGFCETRGHYRTFKNERVIEYFESLGEAVDFTESICATNKLDFNVSANGGAFLSERRYKKYETPGMLAPSDFSTTPEICFTGFKKEDKERLSQKAKEAGMIVRKDITVK
ncbi:MAG: BRCT domain-containing protein [Rouxiella badensis]|uniref:BRCT domain-containing protein n=1 Tax=Rouxiella badensis TaxID=1646377 RepID=UPI003C531A8C